MANRSQNFNLDLRQSISPDLYQTNNTTIAGAAVDCLGYDSVTPFVSVNDWGDTSTGGWEFGLLHSDSANTGFVDVPNEDLTVTVAGASTVTGAQDTGVFCIIDAAAEDDAIYTTGYIGNKRYVKVKATATGNQSTGTDLEAGVILANPANAPTGANISS